MNARQLIQLNDMADGSMVTFTTEPRFLESPTGEPLGIEVTPTHTAKLDGVSVTAQEVREAGLTPALLPNLHVSGWSDD